ncbi:hypothetical protein [uncultured Dokdonia sp.]|uniref:hypothetical protein n=1 Tax=uncultured Dokdonia sp. TaxID=575653 RepID=UPI0026124739|nr:hypothetical protein [uncultured Dokdonia sp.]
MKTIDMIQNWVGFFTYPIYDEKGNLLEEVEERIQFKMSINLHNGSFTGTAQDEESKHLFDEPASIKGFIEKNLVSFTMHYPCLYYTNEQGKLAINPEKKHPIIQHTGFLNETEDEIIGEWEMGELPGEGDWGEFELRKM